MAAVASSERFKEIVRRIDRRSKEGDHRQALGMLRELLAVEPEGPRFSKKKSHFIAALAFRALQSGEKDLALAFLDVADRALPREHMTPFLLGERENIRKAAQAAEVRAGYHEGRPEIDEP